MNDEEYRYLIYRIYSRKERPDPSQRAVFYGWTKSKKIRDAFLSQRSKNKYKCRKVTDEEIFETFSEDVVDDETMIDFIKLSSAKSGETICFFSTKKELRQTEIDIQYLFRDACSFASVDGDKDEMLYVDMVLNLDDYYADALYYIGYRPPEIDVLYPSADIMDDYSNIISIENAIDSAYDGSQISPEEVYVDKKELLGLSALNDPALKVIYSLESFVKVLRDEL